MGEVKEDIQKTSKKPKPSATESASDDAGLLEQVQAMRARVSRLVTIKDDETLSEGEAERPNNIRKAGLLRAVHTLLVSIEEILRAY